MSGKLKTLLSIAGSDPLAGAGIQADLKAGLSLGVYVLTAITAVTAQNSKSLINLGIVSADILKAQLDSIRQDLIPDAIKIGMIGSIKNAEVILSFLDNLPAYVPIIIDPVLTMSADNKNLYVDNDLIKFYLTHLFPKASAITPNLQELKVFFGIDSIDLISENKRFIQDILTDLKVKATIIKGGHSKTDTVTDYLITPFNIFHFSLPRIKCSNLHGTGCVFSSLLASFMSLGNNLESAFYQTSKQMRSIILNSCDYSLGNSCYGPLNIINYGNFIK